jgi:hypothetical protein
VTEGAAPAFRAIGGAIRRIWQLNAELRDEIPREPRLKWRN